MEHFGNSEILHVVNTIAHSKEISPETIMKAMEDAIQGAAKHKYGMNHAIKVSIDRLTGEIRISKEMVVITNDSDIKIQLSNVDEDGSTSELEDIDKFIDIKAAKEYDADAKEGSIVHIPLPPMDISRLSAQAVKSVLTSKIRDIERRQEYKAFQNKVGEIVQGVVDKVEAGNVIVKLGDTEAIVKRESLLKSDFYRHGDRIKAYLLEIDHEAKGPGIILSRSNNEFLQKLFVHEVPEVYYDVIKIVKIARDPGFRSKVLVHTTDPSIDAVGSCVGIKGSRVQAVIKELNGEKIDIIHWSNDITKLLMNVFAPIELLKIIIDEDNHSLELVVEDDKQSIAIGRKGQNVKLVSSLVGYNISILTKDGESARRHDAMQNVLSSLTEHLDLEEILAQLLISEGFGRIYDLANTTQEDLLKIQGIDEGLADELITRAKDAQSSIVKEFVDGLDVSEELAIIFVQNAIYTMQSLAVIPPYELSKYLENDRELAGEVIERANMAVNSKIDDHSSNVSDAQTATNDTAEGDTKGVSSAGTDLSHVAPNVKPFLLAANISSANQIAELDNEELKELLVEQGCLLDISIINDIIMSSRKIAWGN